MQALEDPIVKQSVDFAKLALVGKRRKSGDEVVDHCTRVAEYLVRFQITEPHTLSVAILHHTVHEGAATIDDIREGFGEDIASMMTAFEKLRLIKVQERKGDEFVENLRKMFLVLAKDLRVVLVKLADILDNLQSLQNVDEKKKKEVCRKALDIFAPLAERLGMGEMKGQIQDLAFMHLYPKEYAWVKSYARSDLVKLGKSILKIKGQLMMELKKVGIEVELQSRVKHAYSLYQKLLRPKFNKQISQIHDLIALRVIVDTPEECYKTLGLTHKIFKPISGTVSDYIAHPKPNGYRSLHTDVFGPGDHPFEIQIRTRQMHQEDEFGVAAHWNYSEKKERGLSDEKIRQGFAASAEKLEWVKRLSVWQKEVADNAEFLKTIKTDFFGARIFCFTPKGDVKDLPSGATPIDFAYTVHSQIGNRVAGAKVNGRMAALDTKLNNGDVVEILVSNDPGKRPSHDWLNFVITSQARKKIRRELA